MPRGVYLRVKPINRGPLSEETKRKISLAKKGVKQSEDARRKNSERSKGKLFPVLALERAIEINTGKHRSAETCEKIRVANQRVFRQESVRREISERQKGDRSHNWKGGITPENKRLRNSIQYKLWREAIFSRDNWTCQDCGKRGSTILHPHHVKPFADFPELRFAIDNGRTLCVICHKKVHQTMKFQEVKYA